MESNLYVDTELLREHGTVKSEEYIIATDLLEHLLNLKNALLPNINHRLEEAIADAQRLVDYLFLMRDVVDNMSVDFESFSQKANSILTENLYL